jgi:signal peptidase II
VESGAADDAVVNGVKTPTTRRWWAILVAVVTIVGIDQLTKAWAVAALSDGPISIIGNTVEFTLTRNGGSAFGRFQGMTPLLALGAIVVTVFLVRSVQQASDGWVVVALTLVLGGAVGNLTDRLVRSPGFLSGHVVDFIKVGWWPVFNVADSCITVGAVLLVARSLFAPAPSRTSRAGSGSQPSVGSDD